MLSPIRKSQTTKLSALGVVILLQLCCAAVGSVVHGRQPTQGRVPPPPSLSFTKSLPVISKRFAVIVGVEVYGKDGLPPLTGASASANALADTLVKSADFPRKNVFLFAGSRANSKAPTKENIIRALKQLRGRVGKDGLIVFAFAGYTAQLSIGGYLLTAGAGSTFESAAGSAIRIWDLRDHLKATGAGQLMLLLDGVDADIKDDGSIVSGAAPSDPLDLRDEGFGAFMSLIKESERGSSWPRQRYLMSVFAEALQGRAADERTGRVTMEGALTYVARQTSASATSGGSTISPSLRIQFEGYATDDVLLSRGEPTAPHIAGEVEHLYGKSPRGKAIPPPRGSPPPRVARSRHSLTIMANVPTGTVTLFQRGNPTPLSSGINKGVARFVYLLAGTYVIQIQSDGYEPEMRIVNLSGNQSLTVEMKTGSSDYVTDWAFHEAIKESTLVGDYLRRARLEDGGSVERYPTVNCPDSVEAGQEFSVELSLTVKRLTPKVEILTGKQTRDKSLALDLPELLEADDWEIEAVVTAPDFTISRGANTAVLRLPPMGDSNIVRFKLTPKPVEIDSKQTKIFFTLWHEGAFLGQMAYDVLVVKTAANAERKKPALSRAARSENSMALTAEKPGAGAAPPPPAPKPTGPAAVTAKDSGVGDDLSKESPDGEAAAPKQTLRMNLNREPPDLSVIIFSTDPQGRGESQIIINTKNNVLRHIQGSFVLPSGLDDWLALRYGRLRSLSPRSPRPDKSTPEATPPPPMKEESEDLMRGLGRKLYNELAPETFKSAFWELSKLSQESGTQFKTIEIVTDNPVLPWELMRPSRPDGSDERGFLGTEFSLGRQPLTRRLLQSPPALIPISKLAVVAPEYIGDDVLPGQRDELNALKEFTGFERQKGLREHLKQLIQSPPQGIIHFAGHGVLRSGEHRVASYAIKLEDGDLDLDSWGGMVRTTSGPNHPLIFFNVCDMGQSQKVVNMVEGWAPTALDAGASGYIGALWPVGDKGAADFSAAFYRTLQAKLLQGPVSIAEVLRETRRKFLENGDPTFLAYVFYGDPNLKFLRVPTIERNR